MSSVPAALKVVHPHINTGREFVKRDPIITYYCNIYAIQKALSALGRNRPKEADTFLFSLMDQVEQLKKTLAGEEAVTSDVVAQAHLETKALQLFVYADNEDRSARFGKNVVKAFYTANIIFEVLQQFGELSSEIQEKQKYAKWKAAYLHRCLKEGTTPIPGPIGGPDDMETEPSNQPPSVPGGAASGIGFGDASQPGDAATGFNVMPGFSQPTNPLTTFSQPTNPPATFPEPSFPAAGPQVPSNVPYPSPGPQVPSSAPYPSPGQSLTPSNSRPQPHVSPSHTPNAFDPHGAAAASAAVMRSLDSTQPGQQVTPVPSPRVRASGGLLPIPAKDANMSTLDFSQKQRLEKLLKYVSSALMYDDMVTVAQNLTKAHNLVHFGKEE